jgi:hypothetical protein
VAGTATAGYNGDGGPSGSAHLYNLYAVAVDGAGNLYIADTANHRVQMVDLTATPPVITTVAGTGTASYNGDGGPARPLHALFTAAISRPADADRGPQAAGADGTTS